MARRRTQRAASVGVVEHASSAVLVTVTSEFELLDRRQIELTESGLPTHPHHHEGSWAMGRYLDSPGARKLSLAEAVALVERVRGSAARCARDGLAALAAALPVPVANIAIRACPALPPTIEETIADNRAQTMADSVMYREALAAAAEARGWAVHWYEREHVLRDAALALGRDDIEALSSAMGRAIGPPWQAKHKLAAAAALAVCRKVQPAPARREDEPAFVIKAEIAAATAKTFTFPRQKTMYDGKRIAPGATLYLFASENEGGAGLVARGIVTSAEAIPKKVGVERQTPLVSIAVRRTASAKRALGRRELKSFSDWEDGRPETELNFKLYRQATNKIVGISAQAAAFLRGFF